MADLKEMRNRSDRRDIVKSHILYIVFTFLYTIYLYFAYNQIYTDSITAEYAVFYFGVMQLGLHHILVLLSFIIHIVLYYNPKKYLAWIVVICLGTAGVWLAVSAIGILFEENISMLWHKAMIVIPLFLGIIYLKRIINNLRKEYSSH